jgi:photosystem II stability/assembly factor-like uncharacterized protein
MKTMFRTLLMTIIALTNINTSNAQWILQNSGVDATLSDVVMLDTVTAIVVGRNGSILRTTNAGATWLDVSLPLSYGGFWNAVSFFDPTNGIIVGDSGIVFTSNNGGGGWIWHSIQGGRKCLSALGIGLGSFYVGADSGWVYKTVDTGRTWTSEKISEWPIRSLFAWRGPFVMGLPVYALTPYSLCSKTEFPSSQWKETILPNFQGLGSEGFDGEFCNGGGAGFIVGVQGDFRAAPAILRKSMSDTMWNNAASEIFRDGTFFSVSAPSGNTIYVCGNNGMIYKSSNGGDTWIDQTVQTKRDVKSIFFYDENHGFAVGDSGLILHTSNGGPTGVEGQGDFPPARFVLEQNYPNPFNPSTTIRYKLPKAVNVKLAVYNMLGQIVSRLVDGQKPAGTYTVQFDGSFLTSGVYFCRFQSGAYSETKKIVLMK